MLIKFFIFYQYYLENSIENLQKELYIVNNCINSQKITQTDKKIIEEDMLNLRQDIQFEENCLEEYKNMVYSENVKAIDVRLKVSINYYRTKEYRKNKINLK